MSITAAFAAKRAMRTLWQAQTGDGAPLDGVQIVYAFNPGSVDMECIYGGGIRYDHESAVAEAPGVLINETALVTWYVRVCRRPAESVEDTDRRCEDIAAAAIAIVKANATVGGTLSWVGVRGGQGDYYLTDDESISILAIEFRFRARIVY